MRITIDRQVHLWRGWPAWLASFMATVTVAAIAVGQDSDLASSSQSHQGSTAHPLRFFQPDETSKKVPTTEQTSLASLPIQQPSRSRQAGSSDPADRSPGSATQAMTTILSALAIVLGAFFLVVWLTRSTNRRRWSPLPSEAVQLLGRTPLAGRQWMQLIRVGNKLVMVSVNGNQVDTITEITDPEEVEQLVSLCHKNQSSQFRQTFQQVLDQHRQTNSRGAGSGSLQHEHSYFTSTG